MGAALGLVGVAELPLFPLFLHCECSNVSSICLTFLHCVFSNVFLMKMESVNDDVGSLLPDSCHRFGRQNLSTTTLLYQSRYCLTCFISLSLSLSLAARIFPQPLSFISLVSVCFISLSRISCLISLSHISYFISHTFGHQWSFHNHSLITHQSCYCLLGFKSS